MLQTNIFEEKYHFLTIFNALIPNSFANFVVFQHFQADYFSY